MRNAALLLFLQLACEQRELKIKKELKKAAKKATTEELRQLESRLIQAERQKDLAKIEGRLNTVHMHEYPIINLSRAVHVLKNCQFIKFLSKGQWTYGPALY